MDETQEKLGTLFGKAEQAPENIKKTVNDKVNDITSTTPK